MTQTTQNPSPQTAKSSHTRHQILSFIQRFAARHNYPPSVREIAEAVGLRSPATIHRHIGILEAEGKLRRAKNRKRALVVTDAGNASLGLSPTTDTTSAATTSTAATSSGLDTASAVSQLAKQLTGSAQQLTESAQQLVQSAQLVPIVGHIAAGQGTIAEENIEGSLAIPTDLCGAGADFFVLKVRGDSMIDAAIVDGDYVVARQQATADNGDIVIAGINEDEATVKRFRLSGSPPGSTITLLPENQSHSAREFPASEVAIYGKVVSVLRRL